MGVSLWMLQLRVIGSRAVMKAPINNHNIQDIDILPVQEPPITAYRTHVNHRLWQLYKPTHLRHVFAAPINLGY
jgi:hypothetical protein